MIIRVEPKEFFMYTVYLVFNQVQADREDEEIHKYLVEHELEPKRRFNAKHQEQDCTYWQYGGCYLGKHLDAIAELQKRHIEEEMLAYEIPRLLKEGQEAAYQKEVQAIAESKIQELVATLVKEFHRESSFGPDDEGRLRVTLEPHILQKRFSELLAASRTAY